LGSTTVLDKARRWVGQIGSENAKNTELSRRVPLEQIVQSVEMVKGEPLDSFVNRHGDWARPAVLHQARERSGLTLAEIGERVGGMTYNAVSVAVRRFRLRLTKDRELREVIQKCGRYLANVDCAEEVSRWGSCPIRRIVLIVVLVLRPRELPGNR